MRCSDRPFLAALTAVLAVAACGDATGPEAVSAFAGIVSEPVTPATSPATADGALVLNGAGEPSAFVSLPPGAAPGATEAAITNRRSGQEVTAVMADGGFDPVAIPAVAGDTLDVMITLAGGGIVHAKAGVPGRKAPRVVRTRPASGRTDVALNSVVVVVFSEPIDPLTITGSSLRLLAGDTPVAGEWQPVAGPAVAVQFVPAEPLLPATAYRIVVDIDLTDLAGDPLEAPLTAEFTTSSSSSAPLTVPPEGSRLVFTVQPIAAPVLTPFAPAVTVTLVDALGVTVTGFSGDVALVLDQATDELWELGGVSIWGATVVRAVGGVATFADASVNAAGTGYTLTAVAEPAISATSEAFAVLPSPWVSRPYVSGRRLAAATTVAGGRFYFIGGFNDQADEFIPEARVESFDPEANTWSALAPLPSGRIGAAAAELGGLVYVVGGAHDRASSCAGIAICVVPLATVQAYDPVTDTWTDRAPMPTPRMDAAAAVVDGILFVIGGRSLSAPLSTVEAYDPVTDSWSARAGMPTPRSHLAATSVNGVVYAVGGQASAALATVEAYDPAADVWSLRTPLPSARIAAGGAAIDGLVYSIGGWGGPLGPAPLADVAAYDPAAGVWTRRSSLPMLGSTATAAADGVIYAVVDGKRFYVLEP